MISVVIPSYRNPEYLEFCITSLLNNQSHKNEIVVVIDGFTDMYATLIPKYSEVKWLWLDENQGLSMATNVGVYNATSEKILILNEDNVAPSRWDTKLESVWEPNTVYAVQQIEPSPSIFKFHQCDCGDSPRTFNHQKFADFEVGVQSRQFTDDAYTLPIFMAKKWFMAVGGWDLSYSSPFVVDLDFFLKLQLIWSLDFKRTHACAFYHFGSRSTKKRADNTTDWSEGERIAAEQFNYKWGMYPRRLPNNRIFMDGMRGVSA